MKFDVAGGGPHLPAPTSVQRVMADVLIALIPGVLAHAWYFGPGILIQITIAILSGLGFEAAMLWLRGRPLRPFMTDLSIPITAILYALCLPPLMPWWTVIIGMLFAVVVAKHLYGGLGHNVFNPAMVGYVVVLISFPVHATAWLPPQALAEITPSFMQTLSAILAGDPGVSWDMITQATPLDRIRTGAAEGIMVTEIRSHPLFGDFGGRGWEWIANWYGLGGLYLLWRRVISWHVPVAMLGVTLAMTLPFYALDPDSNPFPLQHVFTGGMVLGAFFVATDPVSGSTTPRGRLIFGAGVALITLAIRRWGGYPDGVAFAVLLMNMAVPLIDRHTIPRAYGHSR